MLLFLVPSWNCYFIISLLACAAVLDVILGWKARRSMSFHVKLRYIFKVVSAAAWVIVLPVTYAYTWENPPGFAQTIKSWFGNNSSSPSLFILAVIMYLSPNMLAALLFLFPFIRRFLERSNYKIVMLMMWWSQVCSIALSFFFFYLLSLLLLLLFGMIKPFFGGVQTETKVVLTFCLSACIYDGSFVCLQPRLYVGRGMHESTFSLFK